MSKHKQLSKEDALKRYLEPGPSKKKKARDVTVKYISGELPDTLDAFHNTEVNLFEGATEEDLGINAPTIVRNRKSSPTLEEKRADILKAQNEAELKQQYAAWSKGVKTTADKEKKLQEDLYESSKPLARYANDKDLTDYLKQKIHADDPMAAFFREKQEKNKAKKKKHKHKKKHKKHARSDGSGSAANSSSDSASDDDEECPRYKGPPEPPANRFNIWPGYRWDGVNRGNGFEEKIIDETTRKKLERQQASQWGMEDM